MTQYKQLITSSLQRFSVHCGSILHLKINILIYIYISSFPCPPFKPAKTRQEREKSLLSHPEVRSFTSRTSWFDTPKSLVSYTEVPYFKAHPDIARSSSPVGGVYIFFPFLQSFPCSSVFSSGFTPTHLDNRFPADTGIKSEP